MFKRLPLCVSIGLNPVKLSSWRQHLQRAITSLRSVGVQEALHTAAAAESAACDAETKMGQQQAAMGRFTLAAQHLATDMAAAGEVSQS